MAVLSCVLVLGACGGDDGGDNAAAAVAADPGPITAANAPAVAGSAVDAALNSGDVGGLVNGGGPLAGAGTGFSKVSDPASGQSLLRKVVRQLQQAPIPETTEICPMGGTVTISGDIADPLTLTVGDRIRAEFASCHEGEGNVINGVFEFVVEWFMGDLSSGQFALTVTLTLGDFNVTENGESSSADGEVLVSVHTDAPPVDHAGVSGNALTLVDGSGTSSLSGFSTTVSVDNGVFPAAYTLHAGGALMSSEFDGEVTYSTPVLFEGSGEDYPSAGELLVTGAGNASIRLIALDSVNVRLEIDVDGDGAVDETRDTTWEEICG